MSTKHSNVLGQYVLSNPYEEVHSFVTWCATLGQGRAAHQAHTVRC